MRKGHISLFGIFWGVFGVCVLAKLAGFNENAYPPLFSLFFCRMFSTRILYFICALISIWLIPPEYEFECGGEEVRKTKNYFHAVQIFRNLLLSYASSLCVNAYTLTEVMI